MSPPAVAKRPSADRVLSADACRAVLGRCGFGHLAFTRQSHVEAVPIRFTFLEGWLYFRANTVLRAAIARNPWVVVSVAEMLDQARTASVVAGGTCYPTEQTGSATEDASALRGILRLRHPEKAGVHRATRSERTSIVFRMHVDHLRGHTMDPAHATPA